MDSYRVAIIGGGPAGAFSAYALRHVKPLLLDVGYRPGPMPALEGNLHKLRREREDLFKELIGEQFEGLHNIHRRAIGLKLKSPALAYVLRGSERLSPMISKTFAGAISLAHGGLANAWGAGVYRFDDRDLRHFPIGAADLTPYYDEVSNHIGISGERDELQRYFGDEPSLQPALRAGAPAQEILDGFRERHAEFEERGIAIGRPRLAVLTRPHRGRCAYEYDHLEFHRPLNPAIYNPAFTLDELASGGQVEIRSGRLVTRYREEPEHVEVETRDVETGVAELFRARYVVLAAGALNSARIALQSHDDFETRLPILDNPMCCIPLFCLRRIGAAQDADGSALAELNLVYDAGPEADLFQASIYGATVPLRSDVLFQLPLSISANLVWAKYLAPAMALIMVFGAARKESGSYLRLLRDGSIEVHYPRPASDWEPVIRDTIGAFRKIGFQSHRALCQFPDMGTSLHYAGTLPMSERPDRYQTDANGLLAGSRRIYVADAACFSELPSKNLTFTIMANAMRIATGLARNLE